MATTYDLINSTLRLIGATQPNETPTGQEGADALAALNGMLDAWSTENWMLPYLLRMPYTLPGGVGAFTVGPTGDLVAPRPQLIQQVKCVLNSVEYGLRLIDEQEWSWIPQKGLVSTQPQTAYIVPVGANVQLFINPVPQNDIQMLVYYSVPLANLTYDKNAMTFPPGYYDAMRYGLAVRIAPEYGRSAPPEIGVLAEQTKTNIKAVNFHVPRLRYAPSGQWDIFSGDYVRR